MTLEGASASSIPSEGVRTHVLAVSDPPTVPGLSKMIDEWQIAGTPEESQFFSTEVSARGRQRSSLFVNFYAMKTVLNKSSSIIE